MKIFFDFEFIETNKFYGTIFPISVGLVREDEEALYIEFENVPWQFANPWVIENVKPYLKSYKNNPAVSKKEARKLIKEFVGEEPEFWAYFADYDWITLCQLYGTMIDLPEGWPKYCLDIKQHMYHLGLKKEDIAFIENTAEHNALSDAQWNFEVHRFLTTECIK